LPKNRITVDEKPEIYANPYWRGAANAITQSRRFLLGAKVVGKLPFGRLFVVLALAVASLLVSYAIVAEWPDRVSAGVPPGASRPAN
jgi:hypothetical protein